jgi:hypothetical protein
MSDTKSRSQTSLRMTRLKAPSTTSRTKKHPPSLPSPILTDESILSTSTVTTTFDSETRINLEGITFVCLDLPFESIPNLFSSLRTINDYIQTFTDSTLCLEWIQSSTDSIFFISSSTDRDFIAAVHACTVIEVIFILNSEAKISQDDFPKLAGVFHQHEKLVVVLEDMLNWFEHDKREVFAFENDNIFLWSQLWKEEVSK